LLVDEAGQAVPQAAVGALLRCRRAVVVGDPAQLEPVVVLPDKLVRAICSHFGVEAEQWAAPAASVQTLADTASAFRTELESISRSRAVGIPLLVHRRCSEPMFSMSDKIAYGGLMVYAKESRRRSAIARVLGPSQWFHVEGSGPDKWCEQEGETALALLRKLAEARVDPDLYILTPFVIVADSLRHLVPDSGVLEGWIEADLWLWTNERIGTVHTAQGREAEAVILLLGAPRPDQTGARNWAGGRPNLLNVAVTRAREVIYVIGNRNLWRQAGCFEMLERYLRG
ncbi:MAG: DEAD/DEAH box helicase, partial [Bryobacteraceae bacterium]